MFDRSHSEFILLRTTKRWLLVCLLALATVGFTDLATAASRKVSRAARAQNKVDKRLALQREGHRKLREKFNQTLETLAQECEDNNLAEAAAHVRKQAEFNPRDPTRVETLPTHVQPNIPASLPEEERNWRIRLRHARRQYAKNLYLLSRQALNAGFPSFAYDLIREVVRNDSDHKIARRLLGHVQQGDRWVTPFAAKMAGDRYVWHDQFGWLRKSHVTRYENGERYYRKHWISAEKETALRQDFKNAWEIRTENYLVKTNHSLERGVEIAKSLEEFHVFFIQTFAGFFNSPQQLQKLFRGSGGKSHTRGRQKPYVVYYYRTREEYASRLREKIPMIDITNGLYYTTDRIAYFFHDPDLVTNATLFHEASHQLFYEATARDRNIAENEHFWIIEGIACYMESFRKEEDRYSLGDPRYTRFVAARYRLLGDGYYIPLNRFASMGLREFQSDTQNIAKNYSQASGLSHFFMNYDNGRYRDALITHLAQLYRAKTRRAPSVSSLETLTDVSYEELDRQYSVYLEEMENALAASGR